MSSASHDAGSSTARRHAYVRPTRLHDPHGRHGPTDPRIRAAWPRSRTDAVACRGDAAPRKRPFADAARLDDNARVLADSTRRAADTGVTSVPGSSTPMSRRRRVVVCRAAQFADLDAVLTTVEVLENGTRRQACRTAREEMGTSVHDARLDRLERSSRGRRPTPRSSFAVRPARRGRAGQSRRARRDSANRATDALPFLTPVSGCVAVRRSAGAARVEPRGRGVSRRADRLPRRAHAAGDARRATTSKTSATSTSSSRSGCATGRRRCSTTAG